MFDLLSQWSFVLAGSVVMAGAVWSYFQTPATRQLTYVPVAMIGSGLSVMYVMALVFITELIGEIRLVVHLLTKINVCFGNS